MVNVAEGIFTIFLRITSIKKRDCKMNKTKMIEESMSLYLVNLLHKGIRKYNKNNLLY